MIHGVLCITYVNKYSAKKSSKRDLEIGIENGVVGCGNKRLNNATRGDHVIINGNEDGIKYVVIGRLIEKIDSCDKWIIEGGHKWPYNWKYEPLTPIFQYTSDIKIDIKKICSTQEPQPKGIYYGHVFNSRFCSKKYNPVVDFLVDKFGIGHQSSEAVTTTQ